MNRLRILYLVPDLFGPPNGIARYCRMVCRALGPGEGSSIGHDLTVVSLLDSPAARRQAKRAIPHARYWPCDGNRARFVQRALRCATQGTPGGGRPDIILVGHPNLAPLGHALARLSRARLASFIYGIDAWQPLSPSRRSALASSDLILSISRFTARRASEENGVPLEKVRILHNCLDPLFQAPAGSTSSPSSSTCEPPPGAPRSKESNSSEVSLLTVARITLSEQYKGHDVVIRALPALRGEFPWLVYNVVGDGDGRPLLEALAREVGVAEAVRFHGVVSNAELARRYEEAAVFVMPSRFEGFGFVFLEAMAHGKPVVAGREDASPEVVRDGETGFTVDPTSASEVAAAVGALLRDEGLRRRMGKRGAEVVARDFSFGRFQKFLLDDLHNCMH